MSKETKIRFTNAFQAMEAIGIKEDKVKPVLKTLLKLYDKNWVLIEAENYRALADAIFEGAEKEVEECAMKNADNETRDHLVDEAQEAQEPERPLKRVKRRYLDGQTSSLNTSNTSIPTAPLVRSKEKPGELSKGHHTKLNGPQGMEDSPQKKSKKTLMTPLVVTPQLLDQSNRKQPSSSNSLVHENGDPSHPSSISRSQQSPQLTNDSRFHSHPMRLRDRGADAASLQTPSSSETPLVVTPQSLGQSNGKQSGSSNSLVHENGDPSHPSSISRSQQSPQLANDSRFPSHPMRLRDRGADAASLQTPSNSETPLVVTPQSLGQNNGKQPSSSNSLVHENGDPSHPSNISRSQQSPQLTNDSRFPSHPMRLRDRGADAASLQTPSNSETPLVVTPQSLGQNNGKQPSSSNSLVHENGDPNHPSSINRSQQSPQLTNDSRFPSHPMRLRDKGADAASLQTPSKDKRPVPKSSSRAVQLKESKDEPDTIMLPKKKKTANHTLNNPKDEPITNDMPCSEDPIVMTPLVTSNGGVSMNKNTMIKLDHTPEPTALQSVSERNTTNSTMALKESRNNGDLETSRGECSSNLEIASSPSGEVKISLSYKLAPGRPDFHMPSLEAILKSVEDKCIRSPETLDSNISMMDLMKEMCECFLELGTDINKQSVILDAIRSSAVNARGAKVSGISSLKGLVYSRSGANVPQPISPPLNGINGGPQLDKMDAEDEMVIESENQGSCTEKMDVVDIAEGQEKFGITLVNEVNDELPPSFCYIRHNAIYQNAYANSCLARIGENSCCATCSGDCLSLSIPCACSFETGGEFAYTTDGLVKEELLKECISMNRDPKKHCQYFCEECPLEKSKCEDIIEPCKGHLVRKFIKECWIKCGCNIKCGNRVVQRGISRKLQVFMTPEGKGWGLRTLEDLPKGAFVCEYVGEVLTNAELFERVLGSPEEEKHSYPVLLDADWCAEGVLKDEEALCLDATYYGNVARFINHKCHDSNLVEIPVEVETLDHHYYHLAFFTTRKVKAMEELTWDYGIDFDDHEHPIKAFRCQCGSRFCRNIKRSGPRTARRWSRTARR